MKLRYDKAACLWSQGLPIGNGSLGAVVISDMRTDTWSVTETTYWSGRSERTPSRSEGKCSLALIRDRLFAGDYAEGERLVSELLQPVKGNFGTNMPLGEVRIFFDHGDGCGMSRELDLEEAIVSATYEADGRRYVRETFASNPHGVIVSRVRATGSGDVSFELSVSGSTDRFAVTGMDGGTLSFACQATETMHSDGTCGVCARGVIRVVAQGGEVRAEEGRLVVRDADEACILLAVSTDYGRESADWMTEPARRVELAATLGFERLREGHVADYRKFFSRVKLKLCGSEAIEGQSLDRRMAALRAEGEAYAADPGLFALFYQYGRYLTIAGSRESSRLPMHLQGIWNDGEANRMAWSCDYHLDVNTEMNYYPVESANLAESHKPLLAFVERLAEAGRDAARDYYGCRGWVAHVFTNAWGFSAPGWHYSWGMNVTGGLWLAMQLIEHYEFNRDETFLRESAYPALRAAAEFYLDYMAVDPRTGHLVTGPANSPENSFHPIGSEGASRTMSMGPTMDTMLVRRLLAFLADMSGIVGEVSAFRARVMKALMKLPPLAIGKHGQLQEWLEDYEEAQPDHRHLSHLYGLYPGNEIQPDRTPELAAAAKTTLDNRQRASGLEDVEFTLALFAAGRARLREGNEACKQLAYLIGELCFDNLLTFSKPGIAGAETYIFVADGNFGGTAAIGEMLLQSHEGDIHLLPALPRSWREGKYEGLKARGNAEVSATWEAGRLTGATVRALSPIAMRLRYGDRLVELALGAGESRSFDGELNAVSLR